MKKISFGNIYIDTKGNCLLENYCCLHKNYFLKCFQVINICAKFYLDFFTADSESY